MSALTSPDNIPYPNDPTTDVVNDLSNWFEDQALAVQSAFLKRQQGTYVWTDDAGRLAQTGMKQGDEGYILATKTSFVFDGGTWRLATPHAEFTAVLTASTPNNTLYNLGVFTLDAANSTSTTMAVAGASGIIKITDPGLYSISTVTFNRNTANTSYVAATGRTFLDLSFVPSEADIQRVSINVGEDRGSVSSGNVRVLNPDTNLYFQAYRVVGDTTAHTRSRVRITRIG